MTPSTIKWTFIILVFVLGLWYYAKKSTESFATNSASECPNLLVEKDGKFFLYNTNMEQVVGVNPIQFGNLEEYTNFVDWQRKQGLRCPVLYVQQTYDATGQRSYKTRKSVSEPEGGAQPSFLIDANHRGDAYNKNMYPSYDPSNFYIGKKTPSDVIDEQKQRLERSDNPMDPNWGGPEYTQALVNAGYYGNYDVKIGGRL